MRVASKVATGSALLILLLGAALAYHVSMLRSAARASRGLADQEVQAALLSLEQLRLLAEMDEHAQKARAIADPDYTRRLGELADDFERLVGRLQKLKLPPQAAEEVDRLSELWAALPTGELAGGDPAAAEALRLEIPLLVGRARSVIGAAKREIEARADSTERSRWRAQRVSWVVLGSALLLSLLVVLATVRSINRPLRRLTEGTRAVAGGRFEVRLDVTPGDEFAELAEDFNRMVQRLGELDRLKQELLSRVTHELKTPLVAMAETSQLLLDGLAGPLTPRQRRLLELNADGGRRLSGMIVKLLDLSSLEGRNVQYDVRLLDLAGVVRLVVAQFEGQARERRVELGLEEPQEPLAVRCDADRILQVLENLLENAIKFSPAGGAVEVRAHRLEGLPDRLPLEHRRTAAAGAGGVVLVAVSDRGPGVPDDQKRLIFEKFHRAPGAPAGSGGGVGLGLAICREIVIAHRGAIWVGDRRGGGSTFSLVLPAADEAIGDGDGGMAGAEREAETGPAVPVADEEATWATG